MNKMTLGLAALGALAMAGLDTSSAQAAPRWGLHIGGRNVHLDVGNPHGRYYAGSQRTAYRHPYSNPQWYGYGARRPHNDWHDTSHYDHVPGHYVPHGNHVDYIPPQRVWHQEGHWDRHYGGHHGRHH